MSGLGSAMGSKKLWKLGEKTYVLEPLRLSDHGLLAREALQAYKDNLMSGVVVCTKYLPEADRAAMLRDEAKRIAALDEFDLPTRTFMFTKDGAVTDEKDKCHEERKVEYWAWWASTTYEGRVASAWLSLRRADPSMTIDRVKEEIMGADLEALAAAVGEISGGSVGNVEGAEKAAA